MSEAVRRVQARARELAGSGKFAGWRAVAFELQFEPGFLTPMDGSTAHPPKRSLRVYAKKRENSARSGRTMPTYAAKRVTGRT